MRDVWTQSGHRTAATSRAWSTAPPSRSFVRHFPSHPPRAANIPPRTPLLSPSVTIHPLRPASPSALSVPSALRFHGAPPRTPQRGLRCCLPHAARRPLALPHEPLT
eukprot:4356225-Prymnesium_polylepis.1